MMGSAESLVELDSAIRTSYVGGVVPLDPILKNTAAVRNIIPN
jgi:hypothetical protein